MHSKAYGGDETHVVKLSLDAGFKGFDKQALPDIPENSMKAAERLDLQFDIQNGAGKFVRDDRENPITDMPAKRGHLNKADLEAKAANLKFFVQVRKVSDKTLVGSLYKAWEYKSRNTNDWRLNGDDIPLTGVTPGTDALQVRIVVGGNLDADGKKIVIDKPEYEVLDLSQNTQISLPVPFASDWIDLSYDAANSLYTTSGDSKITLKPLGTLLITTVRSTMSNPVSITGLRYVSNALAFQGELLLDGSDKIPFKPVGARPFRTEVTEDAYYTMTYDFKEQLNVGRAPNDKVIVAWALPTGKPQAKAWATQSNTSGDITDMISQPQTHVYAEGVVHQGKTNFKVVPVMGTNHNFGHGESAAVNCELYDIPKQVLGYFAKYTVNETGDGFDATHDENKVSLVNWKIAKEFLNGKELTGPDGQKAVYKMGSEAFAVYTSNYYGAVWASKQTGSYYRLLDPSDPSKGAVMARKRPVYVNKGTEENPNIGQEERGIMQVYIPSKRTDANYMIIGQIHSATGRIHSKEQAVIRTEATRPDGPISFPVGSVTLTSVALGKYFIGTAYSPIYNNLSAYDAELWDDPVFLEGRVQRKMPAAGHYKDSSWDATKPTEVADVDNLRPGNTTRAQVGKAPIYWVAPFGDRFFGTATMMKLLRQGVNTDRNGAQWLSDTGIFSPSAKNVLYYPSNNGGGLIAVARDAKYMWQALWPIANRYQGDDAD